jgi:hypothetical protein
MVGYTAPCRFAAPARSQAGLRDSRKSFVMNRVLESHVQPWPGGRMEKLTLISQAVSMSVIFYVVIYFLIMLQWPETLLSIFVSAFFLYIFCGESEHSYGIYSLP